MTPQKLIRLIKREARAARGGTPVDQIAEKIIQRHMAIIATAAIDAATEIYRK